MVKYHKLSPIYDANAKLSVGSTLNNLAPQKEIKNLLNQIQFDENILHKYQNWTYHIQWYMIPYNTMIAREYMMLHSIDEVSQVAVDGFGEQRVYGFTNNDFYQIDPSEKVVIFETGVTAQYTFEGLNFKSVYSENDLNGFIHMTNMTLKFKEINGCTFKDKWQCVSRALGYTNNINVPYFLEISFVGYDPNTGMPVIINSHPYLFKTVITGVDAQINPSGTSYTIKMCPFTQYGFSKDNFVAENLGKIANEINGGTFNDVVASLEETLNKKFFEIADNAELEKYYPKDDGTGQRYVFVIDDAIKNIAITPNPSYYTQTGETIERTPNPNKTIDSIIRDIWYYIVPNGLENVDLRVFTKQVIVGKRPGDAGLIEQIYYFIVPYFVPFKEYYVTKFKAQKEGKKPVLPIRNLADHINFLQQNGLLSRKYEYMYNGRDINVLNFDFKIDGLWYLKPPTELGKMIDYSKFDQPSDELSPALMPKAIEDFIGQTPILSNITNSFFDALYKKWNKNGVVTNGVKYLDDINDSISDTDRIVYLNYGKVPVRADNTSPIDEDNQANESEYTPIIRKSAMEELHSSGKMCKINFEIIGDPFWLGDETYDNSLCRIKKCVYGNHEIVFNVKTPSQRDKVTGEIAIDTSTTVSGFYQVIGVEHNFSNTGKFTQKITAVIDPMSVVRSDYEDSGLEGIPASNIDITKVNTSNLIPNTMVQTVKEQPTATQMIAKTAVPINEQLCKINYNQNVTKFADIGQSTLAGKATQFKSWV